MNWTLLNSTYAFVCPWLKIRKDHVKLPSGHEMNDFYVMESSDWVNIIAITDDGKYILEEQYRHGIKRVCYELPAGIIEPGESPLEAAKRELIEETGYSTDDWTLFGHSAPNASGMSNFCYTFLAKGVRRIQEPLLESSEDILIHTLSYDELCILLEGEQVIEAVMQAPLYKYIIDNKQ